MSLEAALAENTKVMQDLIAALKVTGENQERLIAGQAAAIDKVEAPKATRTRKPKDETPPVEEKKPDPVEEKKPDPVAVELPGIDAEALKAVALDYLNGGAADGPAFVASIASEFGSPKLLGPTSTLTDVERAKAAFFIKRKKEGLKVDFNAEYDFTGDPAQGDGTDTDDEMDI